MKILTNLLPAALCVALAVPMQGHYKTNRAAADPNAQQTDSIEPDEDETIVVEDSEEAGWADEGSDEENAAGGSSEEVCPQNYELLGEFDGKDANYSLTHPQDANHAVSLNAMIYSPVGTKKSSGYTQMVSRILTGTISTPVTEDNWKVKGLEDMLEAKWKLVKAEYNAETKDGFMGDHTYRTNITPAWQWKTGGTLTTYLIEDEVYLGGAHGMFYTYYLTLAGAEERLIGYADIFKEESIPAVLSLIGKKLGERPEAPADTDTWQPTAPLPADLSQDDYGVRTAQKEQYQGQWYPRPALTECGVVFTYFPYEKDCYAAGTIHILLTYEEIADYLKPAISQTTKP